MPGINQDLTLINALGADWNVPMTHLEVWYPMDEKLFKIITHPGPVNKWPNDLLTREEITEQRGKVSIAGEKP